MLHASQTLQAPWTWSAWWDRWTTCSRAAAPSSRVRPAGCCLGGRLLLLRLCCARFCLVRGAKWLRVGSCGCARAAEGGGVLCGALSCSHPQLPLRHSQHPLTAGPSCHCRGQPLRHGLWLLRRRGQVVWALGDQVGCALCCTVLRCAALRCAVPTDPAVALCESLGLQSGVASVAAWQCVRSW